MRPDRSKQVLILNYSPHGWCVLLGSSRPVRLVGGWLKMYNVTRQCRCSLPRFSIFPRWTCFNDFSVTRMPKCISCLSIKVSSVRGIYSHLAALESMTSRPRFLFSWLSWVRRKCFGKTINSTNSGNTAAAVLLRSTLTLTYSEHYRFDEIGSWASAGETKLVFYHINQTRTVHESNHQYKDGRWQ